MNLGIFGYTGRRVEFLFFQNFALRFYRNLAALIGEGDTSVLLEIIVTLVAAILADVVEGGGMNGDTDLQSLLPSNVLHCLCSRTEWLVIFLIAVASPRPI